MAAATQYENLRRWTKPPNYAGESWPDYYSAGVGQSRDSDALERSNFAVMIDKLGGESDTVLVVREHHWAVGWVEWIAIHESDTAALDKADEQMGRLENYPVLDEDDWGVREDEECRQTWEECFDWRERAEYLRSHSYTGGFADLAAAVRGSWYHAANVLHCPSEILA